eukprot:scaffold47_cov258-Pinguiococcus_pyrenoidosus.AAC.61
MLLPRCGPSSSQAPTNLRMLLKDARSQAYGRSATSFKKSVRLHRQRTRDYHRYSSADARSWNVSLGFCRDHPADLLGLLHGSAGDRDDVASFHQLRSCIPPNAAACPGHDDVERWCIRVL